MLILCQSLSAQTADELNSLSSNKFYQPEI